MMPMFKRSLLIAAALAPITGLLSTTHAAALKYWDLNGGTVANPGAGLTPNGTWDTGTTANWNTDSDGAGTITTFAAGDTAVFSAGTDATTYSVTIPTGVIQSPAAINVEEGAVTFLPLGPVTNTTIAVGAGAVTISSGATLAQNSLITHTAGGSVVINGGTLKNTATTTAGTFYSTNGTIKIGTGGAKLDYSGTNLLSIYTGVIADATGSTGQSLTKVGPGVLALTATTSTYTGPTIVSEGELRVRTSNNVLPTTTALTISSGAVFNLNGLSQTVGSLEGAGNLGTSGGTITVSGATSTIYSGAIKNQANAGASGLASANGRLVKTGAGILTLSGANDINGSVTISSATGVGGVIVSSTGTPLRRGRRRHAQQRHSHHQQHRPDRRKLLRHRRHPHAWHRQHVHDQSGRQPDLRRHNRRRRRHHPHQHQRHPNARSPSPATTASRGRPSSRPAASPRRPRPARHLAPPARSL